MDVAVAVAAVVMVVEIVVSDAIAATAAAAAAAALFVAVSAVVVVEAAVVGLDVGAVFEVAVSAASAAGEQGRKALQRCSYASYFLICSTVLLYYSTAVHSALAVFRKAYCCCCWY